MAQNCIGIDIGHDTLKIVMVSGTALKGAATVPIPENLIKNNRVVSIDVLGELIRNTMKENDLSGKKAAIALYDDRVYLRNITMPEMTADQLNYNLPYEFRDYITDELKEYRYDYAMIPQEKAKKVTSDPDVEDLGQEEKTMNLLACAASIEYLDEMNGVIRKAGMKMEKAAPAAYAYTGIIRGLRAPKDQEYCFLDLGHEAIRMHFFRGENYIITRTLELGISSVEQVIAENAQVDIHLAHTYLISNHERCQDSDPCIEAYNNIAVELQRALNFYLFSNPDSNLQDVWVCGGGAAIKPLVNIIQENLDVAIHEGRELVPGTLQLGNENAYLQAYGIAVV